MNNLFTNPTVIVPAVAWLVAQSLKFGFKAVGGDFNLRYFVKSGNMPSVHTAIVTSLLVAVGFVDGMGCTFFGISLVLAMIVVYDAINVRRAVGEQGTLLERLIRIQRDRLNRLTPKDEKIDLIEVFGHTPVEVVAGAFVGLIVGFLLMHNYWSQRTSNFFWVYGQTEQRTYKLIMVAILIISVIAYISLKKKSIRKLPSANNLSRKIIYSWWLPSTFGLFLLWAHNVNLALFSSKLLTLLNAVWLILATIILLPKAASKFKNNHRGEAKALRKAQKQKRQKRRKK